jgi:hypothetical protein
VTAGTHSVEFRYDRSPFHRGVLLQATAFLALLLGVAIGSGRRS